MKVLEWKPENRHFKADKHEKCEQSRSEQTIPSLRDSKPIMPDRRASAELGFPKNHLSSVFVANALA